MSFTNRRVRIRDVRPRVDDGRFPATASVGEPVTVAADVFADSHDVVSAEVAWRAVSAADEWHEVPMEPLGNDRWTAAFEVDAPGPLEFRVIGWIDRPATWLRDLRARVEGDVLTEIDLAVGSRLATELAASAAGADQDELTEVATVLADTDRTLRSRADAAMTDRVADVLADADPRRFATGTDPFPVRVDRARARFSSWYELFPRSAAPEPGRHGTFDDVIARLPYVRDMGFDVLYLP
ncbi:MAG: maltotransferase domain-containing protein, partial [Ilumatobacteraceae bacterium]